MRNVSDKSCTENQTHILFIYPPPPKIVRCNVEKCSRVGEATDDSMAHAHIALGT